MMNRFRSIVIFIVIIFTSTYVLSQDLCSDLVTRALEKVGTSCKNPGQNTICYGNGLLFAQAQPGAAIMFQQEGDVISISDSAGITHSPLDTDAEIWGVSLMSLRADIPETSPGQVVQIIVFGNVEVGDIEQNAFRFQTGIGVPQCSQAPSSGIMVRTPSGLVEVSLNINEVDIVMGSTAFIEADIENGMDITMLDGNARITAQGMTQPVSFSQEINIPLQMDGDNLVPAAPPSPAQTWDAAKVSTVFSVYNTLNTLGTEAESVVIPTLTNVPQQPSTATSTPTLTLMPTFTFTPTVTNTPIPCTIMATSINVLTRVGPGFNRGSFVFLEPNKPIDVTGKKLVDNGTWWQLDKFQVASNAASVNELWVAESDVDEQGDCQNVIDVDAPPIVRISPTPRPQPTNAPSPTINSDIVPAVEPFIRLWAEETSVLSGECTTVFATVQFISEAYFDGPGFVEDDTVEGPSWQTDVCPPSSLGKYTYTLEVFSLTGQLVQRTITIDVI